MSITCVCMCITVCLHVCQCVFVIAQQPKFLIGKCMYRVSVDE